MPVDDHITAPKKPRPKTGARLYCTWTNMLTRIRNPNAKGFANYGGRGITVCEEWKRFSEFRKWAEATGYRDDLTIERRDVNGNYCPENCEWISRAAQNLNRRNNRIITAFGETKPLAEWARDPRCTVGRRTLSDRLGKYDAEFAISAPPINHNEAARKRAIRTATAFGQTKLVVEWAEDPRCVVLVRLLGQRIKVGWDAERAMTTPANPPGVPFRTRSGGMW